MSEPHPRGPDRPSDAARRAEADAVLARVRRESETLASSSLARIGKHFAADDARAGDGPVDPVELWGRRIGRSLSLVGVVVLTYWLGLQLRWW